MNDVVRDGFELESPLTASMIEALHDSGYPFPTAIADLIDNSTPASAKNIWMTFWRAGKTSYITIPDNGTRMTNQELARAIRLSRRNPLPERARSGLEQLDLSLRTASFSQCHCITVGGRTAIGVDFVLFMLRYNCQNFNS